jgi:hypothetical protein
MSYSTSKLTTIADCDQAIATATDRKSDLQFEQTVTARDLSDQEKTTALTNASLISVNAQITGTQAAIAAMPDGELKDDLVSKLRRLNDRKDNLDERLLKGGNASLLDTELDAQLLQVQIAEIDVYLAAVATRKAAL